MTETFYFDEFSIEAHNPIAMFFIPLHFISVIHFLAFFILIITNNKGTRMHFEYRVLLNIVNLTIT